jgi:hypothetical protein
MASVRHRVHPMSLTVCVCVRLQKKLRALCAMQKHGELTRPSVPHMPPFRKARVPTKALSGATATKV